MPLAAGSERHTLPAPGDLWLSRGAGPLLGLFTDAVWRRELCCLPPTPPGLPQGHSWRTRHPRKGQQDREVPDGRDRDRRICEWFNPGYAVNRLLFWDGGYGPIEKTKLPRCLTFRSFLFQLEVINKNLDFKTAFLLHLKSYSYSHIHTVWDSQTRESGQEFQDYFNRRHWVSLLEKQDFIRKCLLEI